MKASLRAWVALVIVQILPAVAAPRGNAPGDFAASMTVRVYNYAGVPPSVWAEAKNEAGRILAVSAVRIVWVECPLKNEAVDSVCRSPLAATDLVLRLQAHFKAAEANMTGFTLGFAPMTEGGRGAYAGIYYDRVIALAEERDFSCSLILAYAVAHELGHLLLHCTRHSSVGIMRAELGREELKKAQVGHLLFTPEQCERMRAEIRVCRRLERGSAASSFQIRQ